MASLIDTNILTAFLTGNKPHADKIAKLFKNQEKELVITDLALAELVWVLQSYYKISKLDIVNKLEGILSLEKVIQNLKLNRLALSYFKNYNIDYIDAYHIAFCEYHNLESIYSLDKDFDKVKHIKRLIPK